MRIGYACINTSVGCTSNSTLRLSSYSEDRLVQKIQSNLQCLEKTLKFNKEHSLFNFRIGSGLIPLASHKINKFDWRTRFKNNFKTIGDFVKENKMRISMHPGQYTVLNPQKEEILVNSIEEIVYHCDVLELMGLGEDAKVQIHVGGVYGDKTSAISRFVSNYKRLPLKIKKRLVIENDHVSYSLKDCIDVHREIGIPVVFDVYHHQCLNNNESVKNALLTACKTWKKRDGPVMVDYSNEGSRKGSHSEKIDLSKFKTFLKESEGISFDLMLEVKDKEKSALNVQKLIRKTI